jgi:hypothetical protein
MMKLITAVALAAMIMDSPAFAQSYIAPPPPGYGG